MVAVPDLKFLYESGIVGGLLGLAILGLIAEWRKNENLHDKIDDILKKDAGDADSRTNHVTMVLEEVDEDLKHLIIAISTKNEQTKNS